MVSELSWTQWLTMTGSFLFVIVLLVATLFLLKRLGANYPVGAKKRIKIVDRRRVIFRAPDTGENRKLQRSSAGNSQRAEEIDAAENKHSI